MRSGKKRPQNRGKGKHPQMFVEKKIKMDNSKRQKEMGKKIKVRKNEKKEE